MWAMKCHSLNNEDTTEIRCCPFVGSVSSTLPCVVEHMDALINLPLHEQENCTSAVAYTYTCMDPAPPQLCAGNFDDTIMNTVELDTLDASHFLLQKGWSQPVVLNMAHEFKCGGAWCYGKGSQEEALFRRSSLPLCLWPRRLSSDLRLPEYEEKLPRTSSIYPLSEAGVAYSPHVLVCRTKEGMLIPETEQYHVSVISSAAQDLRFWTENYKGPFSWRLTMQKLRSLLWAAWHHGHSAVVLGAFGCGAFQNDPVKIAAAFVRLLGPGGEFAGKFDMVLFAIIKSQENLDAFSDVFPLLHMNDSQDHDDCLHYSSKR